MDFVQEDSSLLISTKGFCLGILCTREASLLWILYNARSVTADFLQEDYSLWIDIVQEDCSS